MREPSVIIVNGPPGAGKSTLGRALANDLRLPFLSKDDLKEVLFGVLGWQDREWSQYLGLASIELIFHVLHAQVASGNSALVETAFLPVYDAARFRSLQKRCRYRPLELYCSAAPHVLSRRFLDRANSRERHPGHVDSVATEHDYLTLLASGRYGPLDVDGRHMEIDTTDFDKLDYQGILASVANWLAS